MGEDDLRPPFLSEIQGQLRAIEAALQVAQATVEDLNLGHELQRLARAGATMAAIEAAIEWAITEQAAADEWGLGFLLPFRRSPELDAARREARDRALRARRRIDDVDREPGSSFAGAAADLSLASAQQANDANEDAERLAAAFLEEHGPRRSSSEATKADTERWMKESELQDESQKRLKEAVLKAIRARTVGIDAVSALCNVDPIPVLRIRHESPVEVIVALIGGAAGLVAVLNQLLDLKVKFKTRNEREKAARMKLERQLIEDEAAISACKQLKVGFRKAQPSELPLRQFVVYDSFEQALEEAD